jgi:hypothetical protein
MATGNEAQNQGRGGPAIMETKIEVCIIMELTHQQLVQLHDLCSQRMSEISVEIDRSRGTRLERYVVPQLQASKASIVSLMHTLFGPDAL